jgi:hypothetical protein
MPDYQDLIDNKDTTLGKRKLLRHLARQYAKHEMILDLEWSGSSNGVYLEQGFGTDMGMCSVDNSITDFVIDNDNFWRIFRYFSINFNNFL